MKSKFLGSLATFLLALLPFLMGIPLGKYSPYLVGNRMQTYVILWMVVSVALVSGTLFFLKPRFASFGIPLFLLACPISGIIGLAAPPDLSVAMLAHPEREHLRYIFLFLAAFLFGVSALLHFREPSPGMKKSTLAVLTLVSIPAFGEFGWEFTHHYLYPDALQEWVTQGRKADEFIKNYDTAAFISIGVLGRLIQFSLTIGLSITLYRLGQIKIWSPILILLFGLMGMVSAIVVFVTQMNFPKGFEFLFLFFIPGIPFLLLFWLGVALLTNRWEGETGFPQNHR